MVVDVDEHTPTANTLAAIVDPQERLKEAAEIATKARNRVGAYGVKPIPGARNRKQRALVEDRADAIGVLHYVFFVPKSPLAEQLGLDRRMVGRALDQTPLELSRLDFHPFRWDEEQAVAVLNRRDLVEDAPERAEALTILRLGYGWTHVDLAAGRVRNPKDGLNIPGLKYPQITRDAVQKLLDPFMRQAWNLPDWDQKTAHATVFRTQREIKKQRSIEYTAARIAAELARAFRAGEVDGRKWDNRELVALTGRASSTVSAWKTGTSNDWKRTQRRASAGKKTQVA